MANNYQVFSPVNNSQNGQVLNSSTVATLNPETQETLTFVNNLVTAILGYSIVDIEETKREEVVKECIQIFSDYLISYTEIKYGKTASIRLKASQVYNDVSVFSKFGEMGSIFEDAYGSFLEFLSARWQQKEVV